MDREPLRENAVCQMFQVNLRTLGDTTQVINQKEGTCHMLENHNEDRITVQDEQGRSREFTVEALFDKDDDWYALLKSGEDTILMRVEEDEEEGQYLVPINDPEVADSILDAYQIAMDALPVEEPDHK